MVRPHAPAPSRALGFALLQPARGQPLDAARILTLSGTVALNLLAFGLLMMPLSMAPPAHPVEPARDPLVLREIPRPVFVDLVPPAPLQPVTAPERSKPSIVAPADVQASVAPVLAETGSEAAPDATAGTIDPAPSIDAGPAPMQLQYRQAPPPAYPRRALQQRLAGTVMLEVLVGVDGRPLDVRVARSSGHRELDEAARAQVLRRWSFQPAVRDGRPVQAIGLVPIEFALAD